MACFSVCGDAASLLLPLPLCCMRRERATDQLHFRAACLQREQQNRLYIMAVTKIPHSSTLCQLRALGRTRVGKSSGFGFDTKASNIHAHAALEMRFSRGNVCGISRLLGKPERRFSLQLLSAQV